MCTLCPASSTIKHASYLPWCFGCPERNEFPKIWPFLWPHLSLQWGVALTQLCLSLLCPSEAVYHGLSLSTNYGQLCKISGHRLNHLTIWLPRFRPFGHSPLQWASFLMPARLWSLCCLPRQQEVWSWAFNPSQVVQTRIATYHHHQISQLDILSYIVAPTTLDAQL